MEEAFQREATRSAQVKAGEWHAEVEGKTGAAWLGAAGIMPERQGHAWEHSECQTEYLYPDRTEGL